MKKIDQKAYEKIVGLWNVASDRPRRMVLESEVRMYFEGYDLEEIRNVIELGNSHLPVEILEFGGIDWLELNNKLHAVKDFLNDENYKEINGKTPFEDLQEFYEQNPESCFHIVWDDEFFESVFGDCVNDRKEYLFIEAYIQEQVSMKFTQYDYIPQVAFEWDYEKDTIKKRCWLDTDDYISENSDDVSEVEFIHIIDRLEQIARNNKKDPNTISTRRLRHYTNKRFTTEQVNVIADALKQRGIKVTKTRNKVEYTKTHAYSAAISAAETDPYKYLNE